jgi:hypothetical protein
MTDYNNSHASFPEAIMNQKELLVGGGCDQEPIRVQFNQDTCDNNMRVNDQLTGQEPHIDMHYNAQLAFPLTKTILYSAPFVELP